MDDLISRQAAIDAVEFGVTYAKAINKSTGEVKELFKEGNEALNEAVKKLKDLPSAQPEIIGCKDCKCWVPGYITDNDDFIPPKCGKWQQMVGHSSDDYCSLAERRTDE